MLKRNLRRATLAIVSLMILGACGKPEPSFTPSLPLPSAPTFTPTIPKSPTSPATPTSPTTTRASPTPSVTATQSPPTLTPLPTWPDRWESTGGPDGGFIAAVAVMPTEPNTLFSAGMGGAVYKSSDGGETWAPAERLEHPDCPFTGLVIDAGDHNTVFAANSCSGIYKSSDAGTNWARANDGIGGGVTVLAASPHAPGALLAADDKGQIFLSRDGALGWESTGDGLPGESIQGLAASGPDTFWVTTAYSGTDTLFRFNNGYWSAVPFGQAIGAAATGILVDPEDPAVLYVSAENVSSAAPTADAPMLFRSTDGGLNWSPLESLSASMEPTSESVSSNARVRVLNKATTSGALYVTAGEKLMASPDDGGNWHILETPGTFVRINELRQLTFDPINNDVIYLPLRDAGIAKSTDGGRTWRTINGGLDNTNISQIVAHPTDPAVVYVVPNGSNSVYRSGDYGDSWASLPGGTLEQSRRGRTDRLSLDQNRPGTIYRVLGTSDILRSSDDGTTWSDAWSDFRFSSIYALASAASDPAVLYASRNGFGLFRTDDGGTLWQLLTQSGIDNTSALAIHPENGSFVLSGESGKPHETSAQVHRSRDSGESWDVALEVPDSDGITSVAFDPRIEPQFGRGKQPADPTRLYAASVGPQGALWFSNDAGDSWQPLNDDLNFASVRVLTTLSHRPGVAYAGLWGGGTWRTDDGGQSWYRVPGDPATSVTAISVDAGNNNIVYVADGTTPHLYRSTDDGNNWEILFDAGKEYDQLTAMTIAPSDPRVLFVSARETANASIRGTLLRIDATAPFDSNATDITGNLPGLVTSVAVDRYDAFRIIVTVHGAGVWKTVDGGILWRPVTSGLPEASFNQVAIDALLPDTIYLVGGHDVGAGTSEPAGVDPDKVYGIWKSTDDGNTWIRVGGPTFGRASGPIKAIAFHPEDERIKYAVGAGGVYLSPDRGETWTGINGRLPFVQMSAVATDGSTILAGSAGAGVFRGVVHPLIHTADWTPKSDLTIPITHIQITLDPGDPQTLYASAYPGGVFKSTDGGNTWAARNIGLPSFAVADPFRQGYYALAIAPSAAEVLYMGAYEQGVYRSEDGAATWHPVFGSEGQLKYASVQALLVHPENADIAYVATDKGIWQTVNGGESWGEFTAGLPSDSDVRTLALASDDRIYAGTRGYGLYVRNAFNQAEGDTWRQLPRLGQEEYSGSSGHGAPPYESASLLVAPGDSNAIYARSFRAGVYKTTGDGAGWREHNVGLDHAGVLFLVDQPADDGILFAGTTNGIMRSVDSGATWHPWNAGWPPGQWVLSIAVDPTNPDLMYACARDGTMPKSPVGTVMKSSDGGASWFEITTGLDPNQAFLKVLVDRFDANILYLATEQDGVYISRDGGASWTSWNEGLRNRVTGGKDDITADVLQFSADGRLLFLGSAGSGVWRRPAEGAP